MALEEIREQRLNLLNSIGKNVLGAMFPNDFEVYITALELVDSQDKVVEYFLFPLNPSSITISENQIVNVKKAAGSVTTISTDTYLPQVVSISGNFGRKFKILIGQDLIDFDAFHFSEQLKKNFESNTFSNTIKTGYGCIKVLKRIIEKSRQLDEKSKPYSLNLYNLSFGESYLVKVIGQPNFPQSMETNMVWSYNIQFQTLASLSQIQNNNELSNLKQLGISTIQKGLNNILGGVIGSLQ